MTLINSGSSVLEVSLFLVSKASSQDSLLSPIAYSSVHPCPIMGQPPPWNLYCLSPNVALEQTTTTFTSNTIHHQPVTLICLVPQEHLGQHLISTIEPVLFAPHNVKGCLVTVR
ncbi:hypothetical protein V6N11_022335 [Hibiscus sabdariffa]|uniref:Uncharacterized protein n=1 Tax=Hibiscus sabdariffa TaxID=183260 RepID=A0ABR2TJ11_9ROSI